MSELKLVYSFRVRLLVVLATLLLVTLGVQYYLNLTAEHRVARIIAAQEQALAAATEIGVESISDPKGYINELRRRPNAPKFNEHAVINILVVDDKLQVRDSMDPTYYPVQQPDKSYTYALLKDVPLPPLINPGELAEHKSQLPQISTASPLTVMGEPRAFPFPVDTTDGRWYVIVVLGRANPEATVWSSQAARPLLYTMIVLLVATLLTAILVWRFTQPITELSEAARKVAAGNFSFRVPAAERRDEMGALASRFNEMIGRLERTRELEAKLHQAEHSAVVGRVASAIAHEIRNPLNYINLTLDHLRAEFTPEDPHKRDIFGRLADQLKAEVARINTRITEFLNYTRPAKLELRPLDLRATVEDALRMVEVQVLDSGIETRVEELGAVPTILGDAESLRSAFTNLFINALQSMDGNGGRLAIRISGPLANQLVRVEVADNGSGIDPQDISKVFEPYFSTKETGTGLGLAIVKKAIHDHGGTISVTSNLKSGTTFTITLPLERNDRATPPNGE